MNDSLLGVLFFGAWAGCILGFYIGRAFYYRPDDPAYRDRWLKKRGGR